MANEFTNTTPFSGAGKFDLSNILIRRAVTCVRMRVFLLGHRLVWLGHYPVTVKTPVQIWLGGFGYHLKNKKGMRANMSNI